ncbi:matrixin family metalloprotease [Salinispora arenicola]|uniref:matrixin family metalloprotease n=1 Tax=Salinispora arenicola TaxID=168697 RepID=UPI0009B73131|nr:matrixin family metalloprotease [Salinispora arenicola]NIL59952.1 matrixin family metalloprotease [Salinispora arenicola]NIL64919.1 matrixin family metalloprotease [Salinispora arenicola]
MRPKKIIATALVSLTATLGGLTFTETPAAAYNLYGCKYSGSGINLKWQPALNNTSAYLNPAQWSIKVWNQVSAPVYFTQVTSGANLRIADGNFGNLPFDGVLLDASGVDPVGDDPLNKCNNGFWSETNTTWWNTYYTDGASGQKKQSIMVHEIGHALGLAHRQTSSCSTSSIMEPVTYRRYDVCGHATPQADDIDGANYLY